MPGISPILPFLPPKRWSPSPFGRCHGSEKPPVFSRVQGINLDSRARRRLVLWYNPRSRLGRSTQFLVILGAPQGEDPQLRSSRALPHPAVPEQALGAPGTGAAAPRPPSSGRRGEEALAPGLRSPAPSPRRGERVRVCAAVSESWGATSHRRGAG